MNDNYLVLSKHLKSMYHDRTKCQIVVFFLIYPLQQLLEKKTMDVLISSYT